MREERPVNNPTGSENEFNSIYSRELIKYNEGILRTRCLNYSIWREERPANNPTDGKDEFNSILLRELIEHNGKKLRSGEHDVRFEVQCLERRKAFKQSNR